MCRWLSLAALLVAAPAATHAGHPTTETRSAQIGAHTSRVKHAADVARFFTNHPLLARTKAGRDAAWQHKRMGARAERRLRKLRRVLWLELPYTNDWGTAVKIAQRPYPGTFSFLWETSDDEGGHGGCVEYGGAPCALPVYGVAGNMQYMSGTFSGHYRRALDDLRARGFTVPERLRDAQSVESWWSPLAQALAAGWACYRHQTYSHWSASGNGC